MIFAILPSLNEYQEHLLARNYVILDLENRFWTIMEKNTVWSSSCQLSIIKLALMNNSSQRFVAKKCSRLTEEHNILWKYKA